MEFCLVVGHHAAGAVGVKVIRHLAQFKAELGDLLLGESEEGGVVTLEVNLAALAQHLPVKLEEVAVGQTALGLIALGPGIAEVDVDAIDLAGGEEKGQLIGVGIHEEDVAQPRVAAALHSHHHGIGYHFDGEEQHVRFGGSGFGSEAALAAAELHAKLTGRGHQLAPMTAALIGIADQNRLAAFHTGQ